MLPEKLKKSHEALVPTSTSRVLGRRGHRTRHKVRLVGKKGEDSWSRVHETPQKVKMKMMTHVIWNDDYVMFIRNGC